MQRLRYDVYVDEMGRYGDVPGSDEGRFAEPEDEHSWIFYAREGDEVVASTRITWGGDGFSQRQVDQYQLQPFLDEIPAELMAVGERNAVRPDLRGSGVIEQLLMHTGMETADEGLQLVFGCCEPHLVSLYLKMGQRTYAANNINSPTAGYLIPLVHFSDLDALRGLGPGTAPGALPSSVQAALTRTSVVAEALTQPDEYWREVRGTLEALESQRVSAFDGFSEEETRRCIARSTIIECSAGDRVLKQGGTARNIFVVLDGTLEARGDDGRVVNVLSMGDAFGEMAFLLERPRSFDVDAVTDDTRVLSLSEGALRKMIAEDATVAAKLLLNLSKMLCVRLIRAS